MAQVSPRLSTGLPGLDRVLRGLIPGDNLVWQVSSVEDYRPFLGPYVQAARDLGQRLVYFRFARHEPLVGPEGGAEVLALRPEAGFEAFIADIHGAIERTGRGGYYVFDCLSDLAADWYSDQMLGNFFMLTCPYLYDVEAIAYFAILRNTHSPHATRPIAETTQVLTDMYRHRGRLYLHPLKVQARYSPTMYMLHVWDDDGEFRPVAQSAETSEVLTREPWLLGEPSAYRLGVWNRTFVRAQELVAAREGGEGAAAEAEECLRRLVRMAISRDKRMADLAGQCLGLEDVLDIGKRMIGTGLIGGKSVGMLLARAMLRRADPTWDALLEPHDSFYIASDVFYTFLVRNGIWWVRQAQRDPATFLQGAERARQRMLVGAFPDYIMREFERMLDYFGQSPIIVRSSSLLEDNFGNSFAGKYESVFCVNQGPREKRLDDFLSAVRTIYASSMSERALRYRADRGLLDRDEQMALLVQRVSGALHGHLFYPQAAGVGFSYNPYAWDRAIDPKAGMLRLVFGLGTRAVDRSDDDYTRVVALNAPERRPEATFDQVRRYSQRRVDVLELEANQLVSVRFEDAARASPDLALELFASRDEDLARRVEEQGRPRPATPPTLPPSAKPPTPASSAKPPTPAEAEGQAEGQAVFPWVPTFDGLLRRTPFVADMRQMLATLHRLYDYPVDVEFTANFFRDGTYRVNLLQCRPLQVKEGVPIRDPPRGLRAEDVVFEARGAVIGQGRLAPVGRLLYVVPEAYARLAMGDRYTVARLVGRLVHHEAAPAEGALVLLGPGRWGTTMPSLGVPVRFADISRADAVCEIVAMREGLVPDVSLGTHFLNELIEMDVLYCALFPDREGSALNARFLAAAPNRLAALLPDAAEWAGVVRVIDAADLVGRRVQLHANSLTQHVLCYLDRGAPQAK